MQPLPGSWAGQGSAFAGLTAAEPPPALKAAMVAKHQQHGLRDAGDGEEEDAEVSGMNSFAGLGRRAAFTLRSE